eukprot:COSAG06_NODE_21_length_33796_cov_70.184853_12_plen_212_part_00
MHSSRVSVFSMNARFRARNFARFRRGKLMSRNGLRQRGGAKHAPAEISPFAPAEISPFDLRKTEANDGQPVETQYDESRHGVRASLAWRARTLDKHAKGRAIRASRTVFVAFRISHFAFRETGHFAFRVSRNRAFRISRFAKPGISHFAFRETGHFAFRETGHFAFRETGHFAFRASDTTPPTPGHYGTRHSLRVSRAVPFASLIKTGVLV